MRLLFEHRTRHYACFKEVEGFNKLYLPLGFVNVPTIQITIKKVRNHRRPAPAVSTPHEAAA
jgi:hypothetical protein